MSDEDSNSDKIRELLQFIYDSKKDIEDSQRLLTQARRYSDLMNGVLIGVAGNFLVTYYYGFSNALFGTTWMSLLLGAITWVTLLIIIVRRLWKLHERMDNYQTKIDVLNWAIEEIDKKKEELGIE